MKTTYPVSYRLKAFVITGRIIEQRDRIKVLFLGILGIIIASYVVVGLYRAGTVMSDGAIDTHYIWYLDWWWALPARIAHFFGW